MFKVRESLYESFDFFVPTLSSSALKGKVLMGKSKVSPMLGARHIFGYARSNFGSRDALVPVSQTLSLGRYTVCAWLFAIAFHLMVVSVSVGMQVAVLPAAHLSGMA
jgi:hypothetical protein